MALSFGNYASRTNFILKATVISKKITINFKTNYIYCEKKKICVNLIIKL
jgi:hypothetical protein